MARVEIAGEYGDNDSNRQHDTENLQGGIVSKHYDLDLSNSGAGWMGTFGLLVRKVVDDITDDGPYGPVEVTLDDGTVLTGVLDVWSGNGNAFTVTESSALPRIVEIDEVVRFRA